MERNDAKKRGREYFSERSYRVEVTTDDRGPLVLVVEAKSVRRALSRARSYCREEVDGLFQIESVVAYDSFADANFDFTAFDITDIEMA